MKDIVVENFTKIIHKRTILDNINISFEKGKVYGLIGTNGCGKTMLMKAICGFVSPTSGKIIVNGTVVGNGVYAKNAGVVIEHIGLWDNLSAFENLKMLAGLNNTVSDDEIKKSISQFGLDPESKEKYKHFSLGMKQKLCLSQAFMEKPEILILDEPTNALDKKTINVFYKCIKTAKENGALILIASHSDNDIKALCDCIIRIDEGKIVEISDCGGE